MRYSIVDYRDHTKKYFETFKEPETKERGEILYNLDTDIKYKILQVQKHHYISDLVMYFVQPCTEIKMEERYRKSVMDQKFYDFNLEDHVRGCMSLAMEFVDHDSIEYYKKIHEIQKNNLENLLIKTMFLKYSKKEKIWIFAAIGEMSKIKRMIDGRSFI